MTDTIYVLILVGLGLVIAFLASRAANNREATHSGSVANVFNYLAAGFIAMVAPTVLCNVLFIHPQFLGEIVNRPLTIFVHVLIIAFSMLAVGVILLIPYAILEKPYLDRIAEQEDKGWTREDAETSGL